MSFGFGVGDIVLATSLAWRLYKGCKEASEGFRRMSSELLSLHAVLSETSDYLEEYGGELPESRKNRLNTLVDGCLISLQELEALYTRYESLTTQSQRTWDRMRYGLKDLSEVRQRLISSISMLTAFNTALLNSSTARIEKKLAKFIAEVQAGTRDGSVISASTTSLESPDVWDGLRRELEDIGISALVVEEHRDFIVSWLQNAMDHGLLEINAHIVDIDNLSIRSRSVTPSDDGMSSRSLTPTNDMDQDSIAPSELRVVMDAVTQAFSVESRNEHFDPTAASNGYAFSHPPQTAQAVTQLTTTRLQPPVHHEGVFSQDVDDGWSVLEDATARVALPSLTRDTASSVSGPSNVRQRSYSTSMMSSFIHEKDSDTFLPAQSSNLSQNAAGVQIIGGQSVSGDLPNHRGASSSQTPVRRVVRNRAFSLVEKLFPRQTGLVAASDGDLTKFGVLVTLEVTRKVDRLEDSDMEAIERVLTALSKLDEEAEFGGFRQKTKNSAPPPTAYFPQIGRSDTTILDTTSPPPSSHDAGPPPFQLPEPGPEQHPQDELAAQLQSNPAPSYWWAT